MSLEQFFSQITTDPISVRREQFPKSSRERHALVEFLDYNMLLSPKIVRRGDELERKKEGIILLKSCMTRCIENYKEEIQFSSWQCGSRDNMAYAAGLGRPGCSNWVKDDAPVSESSTDVDGAYKRLFRETN